jgi:P-type Mg2+ transporter
MSGCINIFADVLISINLARGAQRLADKKVIVKRLVAIENFGSMNILCSDKTGTITEGVVQIRSALNVSGKDSEKVLFYAYLNAIYQYLRHFSRTLA